MTTETIEQLFNRYVTQTQFIKEGGMKCYGNSRSKEYVKLRKAGYTIDQLV